ncbi:MAG: redoxin domain-containing protein [Deltaproteobacteria bacterium]|nr:redoxin domain-containing protein [Deltaproteobacteria bacterium]
MKRVFVSAYLTALPAIAGIGIWQMLGPEVGRWSWLGPVISALMPLTWLGVTILLRLARTPEQPLAFHLAGPVGVAAAVGLAPVGSPEAIVPIALTAGLWLTHLVYLFSYSRFGRTRSKRIEVDQPMPEVRFTDVDGNAVSTADLAGAPAVLLFFRGNWCPLCMAQIREVAKSYRALADRGAKVVLISPQSEKHTRRLAAKYDVPFEYWIDRDLKGAEALEIMAPNGVPLGMELLGYDADTVLPTVVVIDADGIVRMADQTDNYRVRPEPETFLAALDGA